MRRRAAYFRDLFLVLLSRDMKLRYKRSFLGIAWSLVTPLMQLAVFYFVFAHVVPLGIPDYAAFLFTGILVWSWLQMSLDQATDAIVGNRQLARQPGFPPAVLPAVTVAANLIHFALALPILVAFLALDTGGIEPAALALPGLVVLQYALILGLAYFAASLNVTFRDTKHLLGVALTLGFYLTPIFYRAADVPERFRGLYDLNPMVHIVTAYRAVLIEGRLPEPGPLLLVTAGAGALLFLGYRTFHRASHRFAEEL